MSRTVRNLSIGVAAALLGALIGAPTASARAEEHCVVHVVGQRADGEYILTSPQCYPRFGDAMAATGVPGAETLEEGSSDAEIAAVNTASMLNIVLGTHYEYSNFSGSSISVSGSTCGGGHTNLTSTWRNRISSTSNGCYRIRHFSGLDKGGSYEDTLGGGGNLNGLNNISDSIQYLS